MRPFITLNETLAEVLLVLRHVGVVENGNEMNVYPIKRLLDDEGFFLI